MKYIKFFKPVLDPKATGNQIKTLRKEKGYSVKDIQDVFGFEYPQAVYAWEQGKNVPTIDNLLVLSKVFEVSIEDLLVVRNVEVEIACNSDKVEKLCNKNCDACKYKLSA